MNKKRQIVLTIIFALLIIIGMFIGAKLAPVNRAFNNLLQANISNYDKVNDVLYLIEKKYVDTISNSRLTDYAIKGMLKELDPHSVYIPAGELKRVNEELYGEFEGIGVQFNVQHDTIAVVNVIKGGPAEEIGVLAGDRIVKIDGKNVAGIGIEDAEVIKKLKGKKGTTVSIVVYRRGLKELLSFDIKRDVIATKSIDIAYMIKSGIGYIKINNFVVNTSMEFQSALKLLKDKGMQKLVIDLRGNSGGLLDQAVSIASKVLEEGSVIVYTKKRDTKREIIYAEKAEGFKTGDLVIMVDDFSASAAEIVAGAVQDNDRGLIVGRRTFGKGLVQEQYMLADKSALRLTISRYYTPCGRSIQKPYTNGDNELYYAELLNRYLGGEMDSRDSIHFNDSLVFRTLKKKRVVYGGGGIMPDEFVPAKTKNYSDWFFEVDHKGLIYQYAFEYTDKNRKVLKKYDTWQQYNHAFTMPEQEFQKFVRYTRTLGISGSTREIFLSKALVKNRFKAYVARNMFDDEGFYPIYHIHDHTLQRAVEMLDNGEAKL